MPSLRLIHSQSTPAQTEAREASQEARRPSSTLWWDVWCKPVELTWFAWLLPLNLMEAHAVQTGVKHPVAGKPHIHLVAPAPKPHKA